MREVAQARPFHHPGRGQDALHPPRGGGRDGAVGQPHHQGQQRGQAGQVPREGRQVPRRHHRQCAGNVARAAEQPGVEVEPMTVELGAGGVQQLDHRRAVRRAPGHQPGHEGQTDQGAGQGGEDLSRHALQRQQRAIKADDAARRDKPVQRHADCDGSAGGMADHDVGPHALGGQQRCHIGGHAGQPAARRGLGEAMPGQVHRQHVEMPRQHRQNAAPGMRGRAGAVDEHELWPRAHALDMPLQAGGAHEAAGAGIRPVPPLPLPERVVGHRRRAAAAEAARDIRAASAIGIGR